MPTERVIIRIPRKLAYDLNIHASIRGVRLWEFISELGEKFLAENQTPKLAKLSNMQTRRK